MIRSIAHMLSLCLSRPAPTKRHRRSLSGVEILESRLTMSAEVRTYDGTGNNLLHPKFGSAGATLVRIAPAEYADGISAPAGADRPSAREISNAVSAETEETLNARNLSDYIYVFGQFLDHDLDLTTSASPGEAFNVAVPEGDVYFDPNATGTQAIRLNRSKYAPATGTSAQRPRQQVNEITSWIDASVVYGSDAARADALRTHVGGKLKTSPGDLLPLNNATYFDTPLANANDAHRFADTALFVGGDVRANENIELMAMQTLFLREHNRLADQIAAAHPRWSDEAIYQQARALVGAELQAITYKEFLPALLGSNALPAYRGYNPRVNPGIANEFSTALFRLGHSLLGDDVEFLDNEGEEVREEVALSDAFFNPTIIGPAGDSAGTGIDPVLKYLATDNARELDTVIVNSVRNFLFGLPGQGGFDLASLNIQRGRDHGLADYNAVRAAYGLRPVATFAQITSDVVMQENLRELYGNVNNIDVWVGALAEDHLPGSSTGSLLRAAMIDQFRRLRDGDRFWYQRAFSGAQLRMLENTTLADIIRRNTDIDNVQDNVFFFDVRIGGRVFVDGNGDGNMGRNDPALARATVELLDADGVVIATTKSSVDGRYEFRDLHSAGKYTVRVLSRDGLETSAASSREVHVTRGQVFKDAHLALVRRGRGATGALNASAAIPTEL